jgi:hypothetical protein
MRCTSNTTVRTGLVISGSLSAGILLTNNQAWLHSLICVVFAVGYYKYLLSGLLGDKILTLNALIQSDDDFNKAESIVNEMMGTIIIEKQLKPASHRNLP